MAKNIWIEARIKVVFRAVLSAVKKPEEFNCFSLNVENDFISVILNTPAVINPRRKVVVKKLAGVMMWSQDKTPGSMYRRDIARIK